VAGLCRGSRKRPRGSYCNREFQGLTGSPPPAATPFDGAGRSLGEVHALETRLSEAVCHWIAAAVKSL
jgi:hypothetical protein